MIDRWQKLGSLGAHGIAQTQRVELRCRLCDRKLGQDCEPMDGMRDVCKDCGRRAIREKMADRIPPPTPFPPLSVTPRPLERPKLLAVDLNEAAQMLSVHVATIRREIDRGNIVAIKLGRVWRVRVSELEDYLTRAEKRR